MDYQGSKLPYVDCSCLSFLPQYLYKGSDARFKVFTALNRMFIGPCIIVIVEELETNLMSLVIFITLNICSTCFEHGHINVRNMLSKY